MVEKSNPELIPFLSSCKSPQMMMGAVLKDYFATHATVRAVALRALRRACRGCPHLSASAAK